MNPLETTLKRKEVFYSEEPLAKSVKSENLVEHETKWVDLEEIHSDLISKFQANETFPQRLSKICTYMEDPGEVKRIYITLDEATELCICLTIQKKKVFESEAMSEGVFVEENNQSGSYTEIKLHESIYENDGYKDNQILQIRCSENGHLNELVKIEKGRDISGTKGMELFEMIVPWFDLRKVYLYDDAQVPYSNKNGKEQFFSIRKCSIFREDGKSWYEKKGFNLFSCVDMPVLNVLKLTQDPEEYLGAKEFVCKTLLSDLRIYTGDFPVVCKRVMALQNRYLPNVQTDATVKDLISNIVQASQSPLEKQSISAKNDLLFFFDKCMKPWYSPDENSNLQKYLKAIRIIEDARIYVKEYM